MHRDCTPEMWRAKPCQEWTGSCASKCGYGYVHWRKKNRYVHRIAYALAHGMMVEQLTSSEVVCHHCDNPPCFEPLHLFLGTRSDNMRDMRVKGRGSPPPAPQFGEAHSQAKLTDAQVLEIRAAYAAGGVSQRELAERSGVTQALVGMIVRRVIWTHLEGELPDITSLRKANQFRPEGRLAHAAKLTDELVRQMRADRRAGASLNELSRRYGVSVPTAHNVATGRSWKHVH